MSALGRQRPFISMVFAVTERPLPVKADVQILLFEKLLGNDRFTLHSGRWDGKVPRGRCRPEADVGTFLQSTRAVSVVRGGAHPTSGQWIESLQAFGQ